MYLMCSLSVLVARDGVHVTLAGEVSDRPGNSAVAAAHDGKWLCPMFTYWVP